MSTETTKTLEVVEEIKDFNINWENVETVDHIKDIFKAIGLGLRFDVNNEDAKAEADKLTEAKLITEVK